MKRYEIRLFMWGYQQHFHASVNHNAESLFKALNPGIEVDTFLVGLRNTDDADLHPVCLEPEDCGFLPEAFLRVREDAEHRYSVDPDRDVMCMDEGHHNSFHARLRARALSKAILDVLTSPRLNRGVAFFFSGLVPVAQYDVGIVLRLQYPDGEIPYTIPKVHAEERYRTPATIINAAVDEFFLDCRKALCYKQPELADSVDARPTEELLRQAGERLMITPSWATGKIEGLYGLFEAVNAISALTYEGLPSLGRMLIAREGHPNVDKVLSLATPVPLHRRRAVRKLLQLAHEGGALLYNGAGITGLGRVSGIYNQAEADLFEVRFTDYFAWTLVHAEHEIIRVKNGEPRLPLSPLNEAKLASDLTRILSTSEVQNKNLVNLALAACAQQHGALLIVTDAAREEAERLSSQCTPIQPLSLTPQLVGAVTSIDGGVLLSSDGICYAIGVILDGVATPAGDPGRGSRFNSAVRYINGRAGCVAIVISEDRTAEWLPNLRPRVPRAAITAAQVEAEQLLKMEQLDDTRANKLINWAHDSSFYLPASLCEMINMLYSRFYAARMKEGSLVICRSALEPHSDMNDEYLMD